MRETSEMEVAGGAGGFQRRGTLVGGGFWMREMVVAGGADRVQSVAWVLEEGGGSIGGCG